MFHNQFAINGHGTNDFGFRYFVYRYLLSLTIYYSIKKYIIVVKIKNFRTIFFYAKI